jgi:hypothetical protein
MVVWGDLELSGMVRFLENEQNITFYLKIIKTPIMPYY